MDKDEEESLARLYQTFNKYGCIETLDVKDRQTYDFASGGFPAGKINVIMGRKINMSLEFYNFSSMKRFQNDIKKISDQDYEEYLRGRNPVLQNAWEEYQLLLKLMK